jgi:tRNA threonylcarbamoyladenosine biosynthesis protein TsaE
MSPRLGPGDTSRRRPVPPQPIELPTAQATADFGARLAGVLLPGDLIVLSGPLGAGKTALTQGIGRGLGVRGSVVSPTFVISRVHRSLTGGPALVHVDAYRLGSLAEVDDLDLDVDVADSITVVEWGAGLVEQLSDAYLLIELSRSDTSEQRSARLVPHGGTWAERVGGI